jgi:hypothetical protein
LQGERSSGELQFRLSVRAASLLGTTLDERLRILEFMRRAYNARSAIVHRDVLRDKDLVGLDGEKLTVDAFVDDLENTLRAAMQRAMHLIAIGEPFPPAWESLMFSLPDAESPI